jgi:hypothetical protein
MTTPSAPVAGSTTYRPSWPFSSSPMAPMPFVSASAPVPRAEHVATAPALPE